MQHMGSQFPDQGSNLCSLHWECGVLITELAAFLLAVQLGVQNFHASGEALRRGPESGGSHNCSLGGPRRGIKEGERNKINRAWAGGGQKQGTKQEEGKGRTTVKENGEEKEGKAIQLNPINILWEKEVFLYNKYQSNLLPALQELTDQLKYSATQLILEQNMTDYKADVSAMEHEKEGRR